MKNPSGHEYKVKMSGSPKKIEREHSSVSTEKRFFVNNRGKNSF